MKNNESPDKSRRLFEMFPPLTTEQWEEKIHGDLKGADYDRKLVWKTQEGFSVRPYYRQEDLEPLEYLNTLPGDFPFVRSMKENSNSWFIRQDITVKELKDANEKALDVLMKGVDSLGFILDEDKEYSYEDLDLLYKNIFAESIESNFICGHASKGILEIIMQLVKNYNRDLSRIRGSVDFAPLSRLALNGSFCKSADYSFDYCRDLIRFAEHLPNFQVVSIHGTNFRNAGSTIVEELAFSLAEGVEYLTQLTERELTINKVAPRLKFHFAVGPDYFMEIAKLRAARLLWAHIVKAYGPSKDEVCKMHIHCETSKWNMTLYDPYVNMLRSTTEVMSAVIGGIDSMTVLPFNAAYESSGEFSERIARNQQLLIKEESYFDKIVDPGAGSYYIENLSASIAEEAWKLFLEVESQGGYLEAFKKAFITSKIKETAARRDMNIASRKEVVLGVNQYPNFTEKLDEELGADALDFGNLNTADADYEPLKPYRGAMAFEKLRMRTDIYSRTNKRPAAFMFTMGNLAMRRARSQFSSNFFACAGIEAIDNLGFKSIADGVEEFRKSKAEILVICSSDDEYAEIAPEIVKELGKECIIVLAGYPKEIMEDLKAAGIEHFIHVKTNVLETLTDFQKMLGIGS